MLDPECSGTSQRPEPEAAILGFDSLPPPNAAALAALVRMGEAMCTPVQMEAVLGMLAVSDPEAPPETSRSYRQILQVRRFLAGSAGSRGVNTRGQQCAVRGKH